MKLSKKIFVRLIRVGTVLIVLGAYFKVQHTDNANLVLALGLVMEIVGISGWIYHTLKTSGKLN